MPRSGLSTTLRRGGRERCFQQGWPLSCSVRRIGISPSGLKTLKLDVDANSGVVSLKGRVDNDETKQRIQEVTQSVPGVTWVQNQVSVAPNAS